jgi:hypothetical protein
MDLAVDDLGSGDGRILKSVEKAGFNLTEDYAI